MVKRQKFTAKFKREAVWLLQTAGKPDYLAWLFNKASLHGVDSWFNRIRRQCSLLERPLVSSANRRRFWNWYSVYRPEPVAKLLAILRTCHNYVWLGEGKQARARGTTATRLGLAKAPLDQQHHLFLVRHLRGKEPLQTTVFHLRQGMAVGTGRLKKRH